MPDKLPVTGFHADNGHSLSAAMLKTVRLPLHGPLPMPAGEISPRGSRGYIRIPNSVGIADGIPSRRQFTSSDRFPNIAKAQTLSETG